MHPNPALRSQKCMEAVRQAWENHRIRSWKGPTGITESSSLSCTAPSQQSRPVPRVLSKLSLSSVRPGAVTRLCPEQNPALCGANPCSVQSRCTKGGQRWVEGSDFPLGSAPKRSLGQSTQQQPLPGSSQELPPDIIPCRQGQGRWLQRRSCVCGTG